MRPDYERGLPPGSGVVIACGFCLLVYALIAAVVLTWLWLS